MGLDVYLIPKKTEEEGNAREAAWEQLWERKESGEIDEEEYKRLSEELPKFEPYPDVPSEKYPDHLFNRRYLRSSYNGGGFNNAVPELIGEEGKSLYWVFEGLVSDDLYSIHLNQESIDALRAARGRALHLAASLNSQTHALRVETLSPQNLFKEEPEQTTSDQALAWYREQCEKFEKESPFGGWWSNAGGHFYGKVGEEDAGMKIYAAVNGVDTFGKPAIHIVYELPAETTEHYAHGAEIVAEFCDEAISLIEADGEAYIHWSA
jgi:hypothetical protein